MTPDPASTTAPRDRLARRLGLPVLALYGMGTIVGGGFYALVGKVAGEAGTAAPFALLVAALVATLTAASYGELSARFPSSAGSARFVLEGFRNARLASVVGWAIVVTGVVSAATLSVAFGNFLFELTGVPRLAGAAACAVLLTAVAIKGIGESAALAVIITMIEVGGLLFVAWCARDAFGELPARAGELVPSFDAAAWLGVASGAQLAFYAFIGFEDLVTTAEEAKRPERDLPRAIGIALVGSTVLYLVVAVAAVLALPVEQLEKEASPLSQLVGEHGAWAERGITVVAMLAGVNGALVQVVMASRVMYGMAAEGTGPRIFARVSERTQTPVLATVVVGAVILGLALGFPLEGLARTTSAILLAVFALVNVALALLLRRTGRREGSRFPAALPWLGAAASTGLLVAHVLSMA